MMHLGAGRKRTANHLFRHKNVLLHPSVMRTLMPITQNRDVLFLRLWHVTAAAVVWVEFPTHASVATRW